MLHIFAFFGLISWASAAIFFKGPCPDIKAVENFNLTALTGTWYEIARYPNDVEEQGDCSVHEYTQNKGVFEYKGHEVINGVVVNYDGQVDFAPNAGNSGILHYHSALMKEKEGNDLLPVHYVDIDYDKHAIVFECKYDKVKDMRHDYAWIIARTKTLQGDDKKAIENYLQKSDFIDSKLFLWQHFTDEFCRGSL